MSNSNRLVVCIRDGSCGVGGIHCDCCNSVAKAPQAGVRTAFAGLVRTRLKTFNARDLDRNPF